MTELNRRLNLEVPGRGSPIQTGRRLVSHAGLLLFGLALAIATPAQLAAQSGELRARSQQEADDYKNAAAVSGGAALEKAATSFAGKYPASDLRQHLFAKAMRAYQLENNPAGMLATGRRVLAVNPNHTLALVLTATVLAESLSQGDPDRARKVLEIRRNAGRAIDLLNAGYRTTEPVDPNQAGVYREVLRSMAFAALGTMQLKIGDYADAETNLTNAAELAKFKPDPYVWYHLALVQDHRGKYQAALSSVEQALQLASEYPDLQQMAELEYDRLTRLAGQPKDAPETEGARPPQ